MSNGGRHRIALIGVGKIARDQHVPALAASNVFDLVATADPAGGIADIPAFASLEALIESHLPVDAVAICMPPAGRAAIAHRAIEAGFHVMLEKPPAATLGEVEALRAHAGAAGVTLFAAWHSREAAGVAPARAWLKGKTIERVAIDWQEDIRCWHPGQDWILAAGGFGVFDPGINALSIATAILPDPLIVRSAELSVPVNRQAPIAATLAMRVGTAEVTTTFDFLFPGEPRWDIVVDTSAGQMILREGGSVIEIDGRVQRAPNTEYPRLYDRFATLIGCGACDVDVAPLRLVADAFLIAETRATAAFAW
jgi:predicted dehydrogenase